MSRRDGIGAYTSTLLLVRLGITPWLGLVAGGLAAAAFGCFAGYLSFRYGLRGPYFALVTLAFAEMLRLLALNWMAVGGPMGILIPLPRAGDAWWRLQFDGKLPYYYLALGLLGGALWLTRAVERSRLGHVLAAVRENEEAAEASGVDTMGAKLRAMALSAFLTALGGTFYAQYFSFIDPALTFGPAVSVEILLRPIVGGPGTLLGPVLGSVVLTPLSEVSRSLIRGSVCSRSLQRSRSSVEPSVPAETITREAMTAPRSPPARSRKTTRYPCSPVAVGSSSPFLSMGTIRSTRCCVRTSAAYLRSATCK